MEQPSVNIVHEMMMLCLQLGVILFAARAGNEAMKRLKMPSVLGELLVGIAIGHYALGGLAIPGFLPHGLFPLPDNGLSVSTPLYGIATIASVILLFYAGLETDLRLFIRYSVAGTVVGIGGVIFGFASGGLIGMMILPGTSFMDPRCLFLGILSTATSVGITARILSEKRKMDSPEGVTILAAAVIDDVLGIICLAVVAGIVAVQKAGGGGEVSWAQIGWIAAKAVGVWLGFTVAGLVFARHISNFLKWFKSPTVFSLLALGLALLLAGIFEYAHLAMIIGAYVVGLSLSKTDISFPLQEKTHGLYAFFVPIFFVVMGMLVDVRQLCSLYVLEIGAYYSLVAVLAKIIGCSIPALFLNFNLRGALRIGMGMVPRGEVALIIAGIGVTEGILDPQLFGVTILMTVVTTLVAPPLLSFALGLKGTGVRRETPDSHTVATTYSFPSDVITDAVTEKVMRLFEAEGFFISTLDQETGILQLRKDKASFSLTIADNGFLFASERRYVPLIKTILYEAVVDLHRSLEKLKELAEPGVLKEEIATDGPVETTAEGLDLSKILDPSCISLHLKSTTKNGILAELVEILAATGKIRDREAVLAAVLERESAISTGMQNGIALPHGRADGVPQLTVAIGVQPEGVDFQAMDGLPSKLFVLVVSPRGSSGPHIQFLSAISSVLSRPELVEKIINAPTAGLAWNHLVG